jgi:TPR repeat protein
MLRIFQPLSCERFSLTCGLWGIIDNDYYIHDEATLSNVYALPVRTRPPRETWRAAALAEMSSTQLSQALGGDEAADWLEAAASSGQADMQVRLGRMLLAGQGVAEDKRAAFACFLCASQCGDAEAENLLGRCYENGWGVRQDRLEARACFRRAAEAGDFRGAFNHASYIAADGCLAGALHWYERALETAPETVRDYMVTALMHHPHCVVRTFALAWR